MSDADIAYRIAEERIAKAKATGAKVLSLSPDRDEAGNIKRGHEPRLTALETLPPALKTLTDLTELTLNDTQITDIAPLAALTDLTELSLLNTQITDIAPLAHMGAMQSLYLSNTQITDFSPLARMEAMKTLSLGASQFSDIAFLAHMKAMDWLYLADTQITDITGIADMEAMHTLFLSNTQITDITPLARMTAMQRLSLDNTQITDITPLARMVAMQRLYLSRTQADLGALVAPDAAWAVEDRALFDLEFRDTPLTEEGGVLHGIYEEGLKDKARTAKALSLLRQARDRKGPPPPPEARPEDHDFDIASDGRVRLVDAPLGNDADQAALQADLARSAKELAAALAGSNEFGALADDAQRYAEVLSREPGEIGAKLVWSLANRFRAALTAQEAAERDGRLNDLMPPLAKAALDGVVVVGGPWLLDHPGVAAVEAQARAYRAMPGDEAEVEAALPVIEGATANADLIEPEAVEPAEANARIYGIGGPLGDLSKDFVKRWTHGFVTFLLRAPGKAIKWTTKGFIFVGSVGGGVAIIAKIILTNEAALRSYLTVTHPNALGYFEKLVDLFRMAGM